MQIYSNLLNYNSELLQTILANSYSIMVNCYIKIGYYNI